MPKGKEYRDWSITRHAVGKAETYETVAPVTEYMPDDFTVLGFKLLSLRPGFVYEVSWTYK
jgi:hypothetical protein